MIKRNFVQGVTVGALQVSIYPNFVSAKTSHSTVQAGAVIERTLPPTTLCHGCLGFVYLQKDF